MKKLTIIYVYRNRDSERVKRSLDSLSRQYTDKFNVIFIDYGSDEDYKKEIQKIVTGYSFCRYFYNDTRGMPWNRSHALNTGIRLCETDFVFTADIDMIFKENFIEKLLEAANFDAVTFFSVYYLPENFSDWANIENRTYAKSKTYALGLALLPLQIIKKIGGYDEFYCFWGKEDNDIELRLNKAGIKIQFNNDEVLMYHQWHVTSRSSVKDFPESWGVLQNDYFNSKSDIIVRNENIEWGRIFSEDERPSLEIINDPAVKFEIFNGGMAFFIYQLMLSFDNLKPDEILAFEFIDIKSPFHKNSRLGKTIRMIQNFFDVIKMPVSIISQFRSLYTTVFEVRDQVMIFILAHRNHVEDYCIFINENQLKLVLIKKNNIAFE